MRQHNYLSAVITGLTLGIVNPGKDGVILKDPVTGLGNYFAHVKDAIFNDL